MARAPPPQRALRARAAACTPCTFRRPSLPLHRVHLAQALTDPRAISEAKAVAYRSLEQLEAYTPRGGLDKTSPDWQVSLKGACT